MATKMFIVFCIYCLLTFTYSLEVSKDLDKSSKLKQKNNNINKREIGDILVENDEKTTKNVEKVVPEFTLKQRKVQQLEHDLAHNKVLKSYIQNLLQSFIKERRRLMKQQSESSEEPPDPDIPIELGVTKEEEKELSSEDGPSDYQSNSCDGDSCDNVDHGKNLPTDIGSALWDEEQDETSASAREEENEDNHDVIKGENDLAFPPQAPEVPIELGSAFKEEPENDSAKVVMECKKKRKPCQECSETKDDCPPDESPPEPDIPIELGSARSDLSDETNPDQGDHVTFIPQSNLPNKFLLIDNRPESDSNYGFDRQFQDSQTDEPLTKKDTNDDDDDNDDEELSDDSGEQEQAQKRSLTGVSSGDRKASSNNDGDFDGELLKKINYENIIENPPNKLKHINLLSHRRRRSLPETISIPTEKKQAKKTVKNKSYLKLKSISGKLQKQAKRSDIDDDKELLQTIETIDSEIATKRGFNARDKPLQGYMRNLAHDVRSVMGEAKSVLRNTGRVVHGLKRVINGATVLTSFTNNAVKFAKYFSMEPDNATIDYLEEKAIVAVLEAQKAANEARDAAHLAKLASSKARAAEKRMEVARNEHKTLQEMLPLIKTVNRQAARAEKASKYAARNKQKTETDVMLMDKELKKMGAQLKAQNEGVERSTERSTEYVAQAAPTKDETTSTTPEVIVSVAPTLNQQMFSTPNDPSASITEVKTTPKNDYKDYFAKKQKELEEELKTKGKSSTGQLLKNYAALSNSYSSTVGPIANNTTSNTTSNITTHLSDLQKLSETPRLELFMDGSTKSQETPKLNEVASSSDTAELRYIASLNQRIANIKREEEEAKERLKAAELARNFVASTTRKMIKTKEPVPEFQSPAKATAEVNKPVTEVIVHDNGVHDTQTGNFIQPVFNLEPQQEMPSLLRNVVPEKKSKPIKYFNRRRNKVKGQGILGKGAQKISTVETAEYNVPNYAKKELMSMKKRPAIQRNPSEEYTGLRKHEITTSKKNKKLRDSNVQKNSQATRNEILSPHNTFNSHLMKDVIDQIDSASISDADNSIIAENYNPAQKRERVIYESKLLSEKLSKMNSALRGTKFNIKKHNIDKMSKKTSLLSPKTKVKKLEFTQTVDKGPISVTVAVHNGGDKNISLADNDKLAETIDPFGFKNVEETNEGGISDRTIIPRPDDYYKVEYQRSIIPHPSNNEKLNVNMKDNRIVVDDK